MAKGLDLGTGGIVGAKFIADEMNFKRIRNIFVTVEKNNVVLSMLKKSNISYVEMDKKIYALGEEALQIASAFQSQAHRPMARGVINPAEQHALPIIKAIISNALLGKPEQENEKVFYSMPADPIDAKFNAIYHKGVFDKLLKDLGYEPTSINEGLAVIYSELLDDNLSGIGVSFGAGLVNVACAIYGQLLFQFSVAMAGDVIDENVATSLAIPIVKAMRAKESIKDLLNPQGQQEEAVAHYYKHMLKYVAENIAKAINSLAVKPDFTTPPKIAVAGGTSLPGGFLELFQIALKSQEMQIELGELVKAEDPLLAIAKGALYAATQAED